MSDQDIIATVYPVLWPNTNSVINCIWYPKCKNSCCTCTHDS